MLCKGLWAGAGQRVKGLWAATLDQRLVIRVGLIGSMARFLLVILGVDTCFALRI